MNREKKAAKDAAFRAAFRTMGGVKEMPAASLAIKAYGTGYGLRMGVEGGESALVGLYPTRAAAEEARDKFAGKLAEASKWAKREARRGSPLKMDRKAIQLYVMGLSPERRTSFLEGLTTFNFLVHMMTYCLDEAEGVWDEMVDKGVRQRWGMVKRQLNALLDDLWRTRICGETDDEYDDIAVAAQRVLDIVNILANYSGRDGQFRLVEVERTLSRVAPAEWLTQERADRSDDFRNLLARTFGEVLTNEHINDHMDKNTKKQ